MSLLVLGPPGSGKSYLAAYCKRHGMSAYDADYDIPGLAHWTDSAGHVVSFPDVPTVQWLKTHHFRWNREVLKGFLHVHKTAWIFGIAENAFEQSDLFDSSVYLTITEPILRQRLSSAERTNTRGKTEEEMKQIWLDIQSDHLKACKKFSLKQIDASLSPEKIVAALQNE